MNRVRNTDDYVQNHQNRLVRKHLRGQFKRLKCRIIDRTLHGGRFYLDNMQEVGLLRCRMYQYGDDEILFYWEGSDPWLDRISDKFGYITMKQAIALVERAWPAGWVEESDVR